MTLLLMFNGTYFYINKYWSFFVFLMYCSIFAFLLVKKGIIMANHANTKKAARKAEKREYTISTTRKLLEI